MRTLFKVWKLTSVNIRLYKTLCTFLLCLSMGITSGSIGPTLVHMEYILHTTTQGMALTITWECAGSLLGAIICAKVCEKYGHWETQFTIGMSVSGLLTASGPWLPNLYCYCLAVGLRGIILVYLATAAKTYIMKLWDGHSYKDSIFQGYITIWSVGAFVSPFIAIPFLCHLPEHHKKNIILMDKTASVNLTVVNSNDVHSFKVQSHTSRNLHETLIKSAEQKISDMVSITASDTPKDLYKVKYLFALIGFISIVTAIMFHFARNVNISQLGRSFQTKVRNSECTDENDLPTLKKTKHETDTTQNYILQKVLEILLFLYNCLVEWPSTILGIFLSPFVIKGLGWSTEQGPLIVSAFRGGQGAGRVIGIFLSMYVSPGKMLTNNMVVSAVSYVMMLLAVTFYHSDTMLWCGTVLAGLGIASSYSTLMIWGTQHLHISAAYCSIFSASSSVGSMISAAVSGFLFKLFSPIAIIYALIVCVLVKMLIFAMMKVIGDWYSNSDIKELEDELTRVITGPSKINKI